MRNPISYGRFSPPFIDELAAFLSDRKVLEIFAGNGVLAYLLTQRGVKITATSLFSGHDGHDRGMNYPVIELDAVEAVAQFGEDHDVLLLSWPVVTNRVTLATQLWGQDRDIAYIGEFTDYSKNQLGGCADDEFFETIASFSSFSKYEGSGCERAGVIRVRSLDLQYRKR